MPLQFTAGTSLPAFSCLRSLTGASRSLAKVCQWKTWILVQGETVHMNYRMAVNHSETYNSMVQFASRHHLYCKALHFPKEPSLICLGAGDSYHTAHLVSEGKLRQGTGGPTTGEWAAQEGRSDHWKTYARLPVLEKSSLLSAYQQCSVWGRMHRSEEGCTGAICCPHCLCSTKNHSQLLLQSLSAQRFLI